MSVYTYICACVRMCICVYITNNAYILLNKLYKLMAIHIKMPHES